MRTKNSIKNGIVSVIMSLFTFIFGFVSQKIFVNILGTEYLGLNGLYGNILSILSVAELGFGTAIIYNLYKPIAENDTKSINILINYYKKIYRIVALIILILGIFILPFVPVLVGDTSINGLRFLFFLSLIEIVSSYLLTYKRSILYADQKNYIINIIHIFYLIIFNVTEIIILYLTQNYILYLLVKIICRILENLVISLYVKRKYLFLYDCNDELDNGIKKDIKNKVNGLLFHNIGSALVQGTDNIIISKMFGIIKVGLYSNYYMITNSISSLISQLFQSITSSVGNLLIDNIKDKSYNIYKNILFINSYIYCVASACIICGISSFIQIWMGKEYLLDDFVLICIMINFYLQGMKKTNSLFKNAAGIFYEDRFIPLIESLINIVFSILLGYFFGLAGVFMGTIISSSILVFYSYPVLVYKRLFDKSYLSYLKDNFKYYAIDFIIILLCFFITERILLSNLVITFVVQIVLSFLLATIVYIFAFYKSLEFNYFKKIVFNILLKK